MNGCNRVYPRKDEEGEGVLGNRSGSDVLEALKKRDKDGGTEVCAQLLQNEDDIFRVRENDLDSKLGMNVRMRKKRKRRCISGWAEKKEHQVLERDIYYRSKSYGSHVPRSQLVAAALPLPQ